MFKSTKKVIAAAAAFAALALGGSAIAGAASSSSGTGASTTSTPTGSSAPTSPGITGAPGGQAPPAFKGPAPGTAAHEDAETAVTGEAAAKAQAAAVKSLGGGTAGAVTSDYTKKGYEVTVTKTDGSKVELHLDSSFNVMQGPPGGGRPQGPPPAASG